MFELITLELLYCQSMPSKKRYGQDVQIVQLFGQRIRWCSSVSPRVQAASPAIWPCLCPMVSTVEPWWSRVDLPGGQHRTCSTRSGDGVNRWVKDFFSGEFFIVFPCWGVLMEEYLIFRVYRHWSCIFGPLNSHFGWFCAFVLRPQLKLWISMKNWLVCRDQLRLFIL